MSDIIREVDEELRRERLAKIWKQYGGYIVGAALLIVAATAGWRAWEYYAEKAAAEASARFEAAQKLANDDAKSDEAKKALGDIVANGPSGYKLLARFRLAGEIGEKNAQEGAAAFDAIAADTSVEQNFRDIARLRAAKLLVDTASPEDLKKRLEPLLGAKGNFGFSAKELMALAYIRAGDRQNAELQLIELTLHPEAPQSIAQRARALIQILPEPKEKPAATPQTPPPAQSPLLKKQ